MMAGSHYGRKADGRRHAPDSQNMATTAMPSNQNQRSYAQRSPLGLSPGMNNGRRVLDHFELAYRRRRGVIIGACVSYALSPASPVMISTVMPDLP